MSGVDQWFTPPGVAEAFIHWSNVGEDDVVLEPAAGEGSLVPLRNRALCFEIDPASAFELQYWRPNALVFCENFLELPPPEEHVADVSLTNPPYSNDGEGTFIRQSLLWAPRCCALIRGGGVFGKGRFEKCWKYVRPTRIAHLIYRPRYLGPLGSETLYTPQYDYIAVDCVLRETPLELHDQLSDDLVKLSWVDWR